MSKIAIVTDTNSGITKALANELGIYLLPMPIFVDEKQYFEKIDITQKQFYSMLFQGSEVSTSQPSPGDVMDLWNRLLESGYTEIVHIPMSSGLSASCETAMGLARDYDGKVQVVNNQRISITMKQSVFDALKLAKDGKSAFEIKTILEKEAFESSIYLMVDTLKYLKKGGRITPAAALLGSALNLKPILQIQGEKLDAYKKVRGVKPAKKSMLKAIQNDIDTRFAKYQERGELVIHVAYTTGREEADAWYQEVKNAFPNIPIGCKDPLPLSIVCHTGPGVLALGICHVLNASK